MPDWIDVTKNNIAAKASADNLKIIAGALPIALQQTYTEKAKGILNSLSSKSQNKTVTEDEEKKTGDSNLKKTEEPIERLWTLLLQELQKLKKNSPEQTELYNNSKTLLHEMYNDASKQLSADYKKEINEVSKAHQAFNKAMSKGEYKTEAFNDVDPAAFKILGLGDKDTFLKTHSDKPFHEVCKIIGDAYDTQHHKVDDDYSTKHETLGKAFQDTQLAFAQAMGITQKGRPDAAAQPDNKTTSGIPQPFAPPSITPKRE